MTQNTRVLAALRRVGSYGLTQIDLDLPRTIDDGPPIKRVAARIKDLKNAGHQIATVGVRDKCVVYRLLDVAPGDAGRHPATGEQGPGATPLPLAFKGKPQNAIFDYDEAA